MEQEGTGRSRRNQIVAEESKWSSRLQGGEGGRRMGKVVEGGSRKE